MKFWENHAEEMRKARLLNAAATMWYSVVNSRAFSFSGKDNAAEVVIKKVLELEKELDKQLLQENIAKENRSGDAEHRSE